MRATLGAGLLMGVLGCSGFLGEESWIDGDRSTGPDAIARFERHLGSSPEGAMEATYVLGGFQDPFAEAELRAPAAAATVWFDALQLPCETEVDSSDTFPKFSLSHPKASGWPTKRCQQSTGTSFEVQLQPDGEMRWIVLHWYTT